MVWLEEINEFFRQVWSRLDLALQKTDSISKDSKLYTIRMKSTSFPKIDKEIWSRLILGTYRKSKLREQ